MVNDTDLYLSDLDDVLKQPISTVDKTTTGTYGENGKPAVDLFPRAPIRAEPSKAESTKIAESHSNADSKRDTSDSSDRKKSRRERHSSSSHKRSSDKKPTKVHSKHSSEEKTNRAQHSRDKPSEIKLKSAIVKAKERMQQRVQLQRSAEFTVPQYQKNRQSNRPPIRYAQRPPNHPPSQPTSTITSDTQRSVIVRLDTPYRIPKIDSSKLKEFVSIGTQTDQSGPCRCALRTKLKNKNRREQFKLNRDLVKRMNLG